MEADELGCPAADGNSAVPERDERRSDGSGAKTEERCGEGRGEEVNPAIGVKDGAADCDRGRGSTGRSGEVAGDWPPRTAVLASFASLSGIVAVSIREVKRRDGCGVTKAESRSPTPAVGADMATDSEVCY